MAWICLLSSSELEATVDKRSAARGRQVRLADVVAAGIISPVTLSALARRNLGNVYIDLAKAPWLPDGTDAASPSAAVRG